MKEGGWKALGRSETALREAWAENDRLLPAERLRANQTILKVLRTLLTAAEERARHECDDPECPLAKEFP